MSQMDAPKNPVGEPREQPHAILRDGSWFSSDGRWRWTGSQWVPHEVPKPPTPRRYEARKSPTPRSVLWEGALWSLLLVVWVPALAVLQESDAPSHDMNVAGFSLGAVSVLATVIFGARLGWHSRWRELERATFVGPGVIVAALLVWAIFASGDPESEGGGELVIFMYIPAWFGVAAALGLGGLIGSWLQRRSAS